LGRATQGWGELLRDIGAGEGKRIIIIIYITLFLTLA